MIATLFYLIGWHAIADFPGQGAFLASAKNRHTDTGKDIWTFCLPMHGLIHGFGVAIITGSIIFGIIETLMHCLIDYAKCEEWLDFKQDQVLHIACKAWYAALIAIFPHTFGGISFV